MTNAADIKTGDILTLVIHPFGMSFSAEVYAESAKAVGIRNTAAGSDGFGLKTWIPRSCLVPNADYSVDGANFKVTGFNVKPFFLRSVLTKGTRTERLALGLTCR